VLHIDICIQVYHLASVRMRDLCDRLEVDAELCSQIWTCFEYCLTQHTALMKDRHLDQIIMCSVYVMAKVSVCSHDLRAASSTMASA